MTPEKQRIAIAEFCGFTDCRNSRPWELWDEPPAIRLIGDLAVHAEEIPDYLNDLNAIHEAEKVLSGSQRGSYNHRLETMVATEYAWERTAAQRCEALLRTLGKWEE